MAILPTPKHKRQRTQHLGVVIRLIYAKGLVRTGQMVNRLTFTINSEEHAEHEKIELSADVLGTYPRSTLKILISLHFIFCHVHIIHGSAYTLWMT